MASADEEMREMGARKMRVRIWEIWSRVETGEICPTRKFETKVVWPRLRELAKEYDIKYDPETIVPVDDSLIDDVYEAGYRLLLDIGILCTDTERIVKFEEREVKEALMLIPSEVKAGEGKDAITLRHRGIEDSNPPISTGGLPGAPISEEAPVQIYQSYACEPLIDVLISGFPKTIGGMPPKAGSPSEIHAEVCNMEWMRAATRRAGRPGMPLMGSMAVSPIVDVSASSSEYGWKKTDIRNIWMLPTMKVDYAGLCKAAHFARYGCEVLWGGGSGALIGGLGGGPETCAIVAVAETIASVILLGINYPYVWTLNTLITPPSTTDRMNMWGSNLALAAINKKTKFVTCGQAPYEAHAGPCTDMILYETAAATIGTTACGGDLHGVAGHAGVEADYFTGLEARFMAEVGRAATGMKRSIANELVKTILAKYEDKLNNPPTGKKFQECYEVRAVTPKKEYVELYTKTKKELENLGLEFKL